MATATEFPTQMYIEGQWRDADDSRTLGVINPADESTLAEVAYGGRAEVDRAIEAAARAFPGWRAASVYDRAQVLKKTADLMRERADDDRPDAHPGAGQALARGQGRGPARGRHLRMVRRGGQAGLRADHPAFERRQAALRDQAPGRRRRHDHPVELPGHVAQPEDRAGAGRRLHGRQQARRADAVDADPALRVPGRRRPARRAWPTS